jgi:hypothetical protein
LVFTITLIIVSPIQKKKFICLENDLNCVFFSDINDVFNYIQKINEKKNDNKRG